MKIKKPFIVLLFFTLIIFITATGAYAILGDVNNDSIVNILDALMIARYYVGFNPVGFNIDNADVDCNNVITILDALIVARCYVKLIPCPTDCAGRWDQALYDQNVFGQ